VSQGSVGVNELGASFEHAAARADWRRDRQKRHF
jgi:hypothetical protein